MKESKICQVLNAIQAILLITLGVMMFAFIILMFLNDLNLININ